jgi:outer membrane protein assembly factor BamB
MNASQSSIVQASTPASMARDTSSGVSGKPMTLRRFWPALVLVAIYWALMVYAAVADIAISTGFMTMMGSALLVGLLFTVWWLTRRDIPFSERLSGLGIAIVGGLLTYVIGDASVGGMGVMLIGIPMLATVWLAWLLVARNKSQRLRRLGTLAVMAVVWASFMVVRVNGVDGGNRASLSWRWTPSAEDQYLAERSKTNVAAPAAPLDDDNAVPLAVQPGDWPEFRGPNHHGEVHGTRIATDWNQAPPKQVWRQKIGPAWSSIVIIGDRLYTQEQRGENEVAVCLQAASGRQIWEHADAARWSDGQAGAGPRGTPTFSEGRIYTFGATGILNCLDAHSGKPIWTRSVASDTAAPTPMWGFSSSPLVAERIVSVHAGGPTDKGMVAYDALTGEPAWSVATGPVSYSSPQLVELDGEKQVVILSDQGMVAVDPKRGALRWEFTAPGMGIWRVVQPRQVDDNSLLIGCEDLGLVRLAVKRGDPLCEVEETWKTKALRPAYNDFVVSDGYVYGLDESILACIDLATGKRRWKAGRYGHGQVLLIADQKLLLVITETGEAVLVSANPERHEELGRFQAVVGKTWNHPTIAYGKLFVRNDEEIACYELKLE